MEVDRSFCPSLLRRTYPKLAGALVALLVETAVSCSRRVDANTKKLFSELTLESLSAEMLGDWSTARGRAGFDKGWHAKHKLRQGLERERETEIERADRLVGATAHHPRYECTSHEPLAPPVTPLYRLPNASFSFNESSLLCSRVDGTLRRMPRTRLCSPRFRRRATVRITSAPLPPCPNAACVVRLSTSVQNLQPWLRARLAVNTTEEEKEEVQLAPSLTLEPVGLVEDGVRSS